jgi:hypothetical protein
LSVPKLPSALSATARHCGCSLHCRKGSMHGVPHLRRGGRVEGGWREGAMPPPERCC